MGRPYPTCASGISAPATDTGNRHAFSICITASCSRPSPHCRYFTGSARGGGGAFSNAFANSPRNGSPTNAAGLATMALTSSCRRDLSPPPRMNLETKSVARRVASPSGTPSRRKSLVFILDNRERMAFCYRGYFQLFKKMQNHLFWNRTRAAFVLCENCSDGRLNVNNLNPRCIIDKQVNPALAHRSRDVCSVESKVLTSAQMLTAFLSRGLDDFALI